ncbi:unnamed protein product, partial [Effrenium voratum]
AFARMRQLELALDLLNSLEDEESSLDLMARAELLEMLARALDEMSGGDELASFFTGV